MDRCIGMHVYYTRICMYVRVYVHMYPCIQARMFTCMYVCTHTCIFYVCVYIFTLCMCVVQGMTVSTRSSSVKAACNYLKTVTNIGCHTEEVCALRTLLGASTI